MVFCNLLVMIFGGFYSGHNPYFNRWFSAMPMPDHYGRHTKRVTILILIDGFLQCEFTLFNGQLEDVTILILIDGFLQ